MAGGPWSLTDHGKKAEMKLQANPYDLESWSVLIREAQVGGSGYILHEGNAGRTNHPFTMQGKAKWRKCIILSHACDTCMAAVLMFTLTIKNKSDILCLSGTFPVQYTQLRPSQLQL